jgi:hypothetical protein
MRCSLRRLAAVFAPSHVPAYGATVATVLEAMQTVADRHEEK